MKKIAVPIIRNLEINDHFGSSTHFQTYTIDSENSIMKDEVLITGQGCACKSELPKLLKDKGINTVLVSGIGEGAVNVLKRFGLEVIKGCRGNADDLVNRFVKNDLENSDVFCNSHNDSKGSHQCSH